MYHWANKEHRGQAADLDALREALQQERDLGVIEVQIPLGIPIEGKVILEMRGDEKKEVVVLSSEGRDQEFTRNTANNPNGALCVSCDPDGDDVPIRTINIPFRPYEDTLTDRGLVWVHPGQPAVASLKIFHPRSDNDDQEGVAEIVAAAETAVQEHVVRHFAH